MTYGRGDTGGDMMYPPFNDLLNLRFRGDQFDITLPYCEVANGDITSLKDGMISVMIRDEANPEKVVMSFKEFASFVEKTFDTKEIVKLSVQQSFSEEIFEIL
jgi:hypothetical protein